MPKKTLTPEQIVGKLRQIEVLVGQGKTVPLACKESGDRPDLLPLEKRVRRAADGTGQEAQRVAEGERATQASAGR